MLVEWILDSQPHIFHLSHASRRLYGGIPHFAGIRRGVKAIEFCNCDINTSIFTMFWCLLALSPSHVYSNFITRDCPLYLIRFLKCENNAFNKEEELVGAFSLLCTSSSTLKKSRDHPHLHDSSPVTFLRTG